VKENNESETTMKTKIIELMEAKLRLAEGTQKELEQQYSTRLEQDAKRDVMYFPTPQILLARAAWVSEVIGNIEVQRSKRVLLTELLEVATKGGVL
jgi:hypothetical protein